MLCCNAQHRYKLEVSCTTTVMVRLAGRICHESEVIAEQMQLVASDCDAVFHALHELVYGGKQMFSSRQILKHAYLARHCQSVNQRKARSAAQAPLLRLLSLPHLVYWVWNLPYVVAILIALVTLPSLSLWPCQPLALLLLMTSGQLNLSSVLHWAGASHCTQR